MSADQQQRCADMHATCSERNNDDPLRRHEPGGREDALLGALEALCFLSCKIDVECLRTKVQMLTLILFAQILMRMPEVPLLSDQGQDNWVFDSNTKKTLVQRLFTAMTGSVVLTATDKADKVKKAGMSAAKKAKAAPKAKKGKAASAAGKDGPQLPPEAGRTDATVACAVGVRTKLWVDDALRSIHHSVASLAAQPRYSQVTAEQKTNLERFLLRKALMFAFQGEVSVETHRGIKKHKRWSTLRPALQALAVYKFQKVAGLEFK